MALKKESVINYWIDIGLAISFLLVFVTGIFKFPLFTKAFSWVFRSVSYRTVSIIHDWSGLVMGILVLVHIALHWKWLVAMTENIFGRGNKE